MLNNSRGGFLGGGNAGGVVTGNLTMAPGTKLTVAAGTSASDPSILFEGSDATTGFYCSTANQISVARSGTAAWLLTSASGATCNTALAGASTLTMTGTTSFNGAASFNAGMRVLPTVQTGDYTLLATDRHVVMNVTAGGTLTLTTTPAGNPLVHGWNTSANPLTIARAGSQLINGATSVSIAAGAGFILSYTAADTWLCSEAPPA